MRKSVFIKSTRTGQGVTGYVPKIYAYSTGSSGYSGSALYTLTDSGDGLYYADITYSLRGTLVITRTGSTAVVQVPTGYVGYLFDGDNQFNIIP